jgi:hypothetical protein
LSISCSSSSFWEFFVDDVLVSLVRKSSSFAPRMTTLNYTCYSAWLNFVSFSDTGKPRIGFMEVDDDKLAMTVITI